MYSILIEILCSIFEKLDKRDDIETEMEFIFRGPHFYRDRRKQRQTNALNRLSLRELYEIKYESGPKEINGDICLLLNKKRPSLDTKVIQKQSFSF